MSAHLIREDWLALANEDVLDPALPIVDPHLHLMLECPVPIFTPLDKPYLVADGLAEIETGHNILATIHVEVRQCYRTEGPEHLRPVGETEWITSLAESVPAGRPKLSTVSVGFAELAMGAGVEEVLRAHIEAGRGRFRGVRNMAHSDPYGTVAGVYAPRPGLLRDAKWREGFAQLAPLGLSYDAFQFRFQLPDIADLAAAFPETTIIVNHLSTPSFIGPYAGKRDEVFSEWAAGIKLLAPYPNVKMKIGGIGADRFGFDLYNRELPASSAELATLFRPFFDTCIEAMGTSRCMFESNFPIDKPFYSYRVIWNAYKRLAEGASADEKADLFRRTAEQTYRI